MNQPEIIKGPLSEIEKTKIVYLFGKGLNFCQISREMKRNRKTIMYVIKKFESTGLISRQKGSGRNQKFDSTFRQQVLNYFATNSMKTYTEAIIEQDWTCSESWICKFSKEHKIRAFVASKKPFLSEKHLLERSKFATDNANWSEDAWKHVIFSDEKTIQSCASGRVKVKRVRGAPFDLSQVVTVPKTKFSINIWGCTIGCDLSFHVFQVDKHFNAALYRYHLKKVAFPLFEKTYKDAQFVFQQDNASIHTARIIRDFFEENEIEPLFWPACSPDLSPIENLWAILQNRVNKRLRKETATNSHQLFKIAEEESKLIDKSTIQKLYAGMPRRIQMLEENQYKSIKY